MLIKKFFRDLPLPIFPEEAYGIIERCPWPGGGDGEGVTRREDEKTEECVEYIRQNVLSMVEKHCPPALIVLSYILREFSLTLPYTADLTSMGYHRSASRYNASLPHESDGRYKPCTLLYAEPRLRIKHYEGYSDMCDTRCGGQRWQLCLPRRPSQAFLQLFNNPLRAPRLALRPEKELKGYP